MNQDSLVPQPVPPQNNPRPFSEIPPLWLRLPRMDQEFFAAEQPHASLGNTLLGVAVYTAVATVVVLLVLGIESITRPALTSGEPLWFILLFGCAMVFITPVSFYLNTGLNYVAALVFGGRGRFNDQAYLASLFIVPIGIVSSIVTFLQVVPWVGPLLEWPILIVIAVLTTILQYRMVRVVHGLTSGRAVGAVLVPFGLLFCLCLPILVIGILMVLGPVIGSTFSSINQSLLTPVP